MVRLCFKNDRRSVAVRHGALENSGKTDSLFQTSKEIYYNYFKVFLVFFNQKISIFWHQNGLYPEYNKIHAIFLEKINVYLNLIKNT
jgi:hypothetical protein